MAFALVGSPTRYDANGTGPVVLTKPTGVAQDDILFAFIKNTADPTAVPSGWTQLGFVTDASSGSRYMVYQLVAGASEGADYTWTFASYARTGATMVAYRDGFDPADPIDVVSATNYTTNNTTVRAAGVTAAAANSPIIFFGGQHSSSSVTYTPPTNPGTFVEQVLRVSASRAKRVGDKGDRVFVDMLSQSVSHSVTPRTHEQRAAFWAGFSSEEYEKGIDNDAAMT